jgi:hypothetical protein
MVESWQLCAKCLPIQRGRHVQEGTFEKTFSKLVECGDNDGTHENFALS